MTKIKGLFYITHVDNLPSIVRLGILSHHKVDEQGIQFTPIYDKGIVANRQKRTLPDGNNLWQMANLYFQPRNPMLYRVIHEKDKNHIAVVGVNPQVLNIPGAFISIGNAAHSLSSIVPVQEGLEIVTKEMREVFASDWWREEDGSKRKIMAECLVPDLIPANQIHTIFVANREAAERVKTSIALLAPSINVIPEPHMFFQPRQSYKLTDSLSLIDGDMFFSQMQTLTISVNVVGIMGKGLASRAKYQFPDVYVFYQDLCRKKELEMGRPYLYKRETSLDMQLAADPASLPDPNASKWFLLFPTKRHWREDSDLVSIEKGLQWIRDNYRITGIESLATPALGCGLGKLNWQDVGPLMAQNLADLGIPVAIYLPRERELAREHLTRKFLLG